MVVGILFFPAYSKSLYAYNHKREMIVNSEPKTDRKNNIEYRKIVGSIAGIMKQQGALSSGEMAELRRISQDQPFTPALWRLLIMLNLTEPPSWISQNEWERRWATLFM